MPKFSILAALAVTIVAFNQMALAAWPVPTEQVVTPNHFDLLRGGLSGGTLESLFEIDNDIMVARSGLTANAEEPQIQLQTITSGIFDTFPSTLFVHLTCRVSTPNVQQQILLRNLYTQQWDVVDTRIAPRSETTLVIPVSDAFNYITPASGTVVMRTNFKVVGKVNSSTWTASFNQSVLSTP